MPRRIDLDELLTGNPTWEEVADFFEHGEFHEESYLVKAIKKYLLTEEQRKLMYDRNFSIEEMLNGRVEGNADAIERIHNEWNAKLGRKVFGY